MEPRDWIAAALVYATLAQATVIEAGQFMGASKAERLLVVARLDAQTHACLQAAGVQP